MTGRSVHLVFVFLAVHISFICFSQSPRWKAWEAEADTLYNHQEFRDASILYTKVLDANPTKGGVYNDPTMYNVLYKRAVCFYSTQEYDKALKDLALAGPAFPNAPQPKLLKAFIYRELQDVDNQLSNLKEAMELQPSNPDFLKWRGLLYIEKKMYADGLVDLQEAKLFQDDAEVETYIGICFYSLDQYDSAFVSFNRAIELDPTFLAPYLYASSLSLQEDNYALCLEYTNLALRLDGKNKEALFYKGAALVQTAQLQEGCRCLNRAFYSGFDDARGYLMEFCFQDEN